MRPIDYTFISVSFVPVLRRHNCVDKESLCSGLRRMVVEQGLVQPLRSEAAMSDLFGL